MEALSRTQRPAIELRHCDGDKQVEFASSSLILNFRISFFFLRSILSCLLFSYSLIYPGRPKKERRSQDSHLSSLLISTTHYTYSTSFSMPDLMIPLLGPRPESWRISSCLSCINRNEIREHRRRFWMWKRNNKRPELMNFFISFFRDST